MRTWCLPADADSVDLAARIIRGGGLVAFPTETVYGLGANALDEAAVKKIFSAKTRPSWDPLIVHVCSLEMFESVVASVPVQFENLFTAFMPGPLTLVLPKKNAVPDLVTAGRETVAVRFPAHPIAQRLIADSRVPVAAPSANHFGRVSPTTAAHVLADLNGRIEAVLDAGPCEIGVESTVLDLTGAQPRILRQGGVTREQLQAVLADVSVADSAARSAPGQGLSSPGMALRHYAPRSNLTLTTGQEEAVADALRERAGQKVGVLLPSGWNISPEVVSFDWGRWGDWAFLASRLYAGLRWLDEQNLDLIIAPMPPEEGVGGAIRERLLKASATEPRS